jgi:hypothetical protein
VCLLRTCLCIPHTSSGVTNEGSCQLQTLNRIYLGKLTQLPSVTEGDSLARIKRRHLDFGRYIESRSSSSCFICASQVIIGKRMSIWPIPVAVRSKA